MARRRRFSDEAFGPTIERLMTETGHTYRSLADRTKLSAGYLNHLVHGNRPVPSDDVMRTLASALGVKRRSHHQRIIEAHTLEHVAPMRPERDREDRVRGLGNDERDGPAAGRRGDGGGEEERSGCDCEY